MKLKYKLFISYLILIAFISIALFLLILQLNAIDYFVRIRIDQDVQEVVDLSHQQQILEDVYAQYLLYHFPIQPNSRYRQNLEIAAGEYSRNWLQFKTRRKSIKNFSFFLPIEFLHGSQIFTKDNSSDEIAEKERIEKECEDLWRLAENNLKTILADPEAESVELKEPISRLREKLILLTEIIGQQARDSGLEMRKAAETINLVVFSIMLAMVMISLIIAFLVARIFSRPLEQLKAGIEQIAIQNFDVKINEKPNDEIGELAAAFEQMALRLKQNEKYKLEMLGQFTHEMKSPLVAISQAIILLKHSIGENPTADQRRLLSIITGNNETLANLITNILHSATYDAGKIQLDRTKENIIKVFTNTTMKLAPTVQDKKQNVNLNFSSEKIICEIDKDRIEEVFFNLLSNAIKFSPEASTLEVEITEQDSVVVIRLKDRGIGIPGQEIPYIFEKMYRASNSTKISVKGTGLGLYITSQIIKAHGGKIKVKSKENQGTEFTVILPKSDETNEEKAS